MEGISASCEIGDIRIIILERVLDIFVWTRSKKMKRGIGYARK